MTVEQNKKTIIDVEARLADLEKQEKSISEQIGKLQLQLEAVREQKVQVQRQYAQADRAIHNPTTLETLDEESKDKLLAAVKSAVETTEKAQAIEGHVKPVLWDIGNVSDIEAGHIRKSPFFPTDLAGGVDWDHPILHDYLGTDRSPCVQFWHALSGPFSELGIIRKQGILLPHPLSQYGLLGQQEERNLFEITGKEIGLQGSFARGVFVMFPAEIIDMQMGFGDKPDFLSREVASPQVIFFKITCADNQDYKAAVCQAMIPGQEPKLRVYVWSEENGEEKWIGSADIEISQFNDWILLDLCPHAQQ